MTDQQLTIGQLSEKTSVTIRTLRYYDKIGLLKPSDYKEGGHRLYNAYELLRLQQIQALKFIGFSLKDIANMLDEQWIDQNHLKQTINFKRKELMAQLDDIQKTIDQLDHMDMVTEEPQRVDLRVFCFMINAIIWEEKHMNEHDNLKKIYNHSRSERIKLDQKYFNVFTEIKHLVALNISPSSTQAQACVKKIVELSSETMSGSSDEDIKQIKEQNLVNEFNVLKPFTHEEQEFLERSMSFYYNSTK
ncbi:MerR family transcriptional regulator [Natribacillus halophilus]|uniref:DNA-binding transcriptional regulator, MerR family n=1 Tax=Natribacillus halophilus TaxID=549003 RepID=A0A1G8KX92_9BACI|nr:MerR family transcriptional regulator [Natribacillus halophilus]SDI48016.1 DNA-binding transcriptional regulator, MerR family [Natribacillus halophilus]